MGNQSPWTAPPEASGTSVWGRGEEDQTLSSRGIYGPYCLHSRAGWALPFPGPASEHYFEEGAWRSLGGNWEDGERILDSAGSA